MTLPLCKNIVYWSTVSGLFGVMVKILPLILVVIGIIVPRLFVSSINPFPIWIGSLKVILIILFDGTFTALLAGSTKVIVGGKVSIVTNVYIVVALAGLSVAVTLATPQRHHYLK